MNIRRLPLNTAYDMHVHFRRGAMMRKVVPITARLFRAAIVMPNTNPPIVTVRDAELYRQEIVEACKKCGAFDPLMTIKLRPQTKRSDISAAKKSGIVVAGKFYPEGVTTNSEDGFRLLTDAELLLAAMEDYGLPLSVHAEMPDEGILTAEQAFMEQIIWAAQKFPRLRIIVEHLSSAQAVDTVLKLPANVAATITAHHLAISYEEVTQSPHNFCKPVAKTKEDREALIAAAVSGNPKFFFGSDSAPHPREAKEESLKPPAGCYSAPVALPLLAQIFDSQGKLNKLDDFVGKFGPEFYGIPIKNKCVILVPHPCKTQSPDNDPVPFFADQIIAWSY